MLLNALYKLLVNCKRYFFILLISIPCSATADIQGKWPAPALENTQQKDWTVTTEAIGYLYNYEWFERHGAVGYTLFGNIVALSATKQLDSNVKIDIGAVGFLKNGDNQKNSIKPLFKLNIGVGEKKHLIIGTLEQSHNIHSALSLDHDLYQQNLEQGIQFINENPDNTLDSWVNWKIAEANDRPEYFEAGIIHNWTFLTRDNVSFFTNEQVLISHQGGQISTVKSSIRGAWTQLALGMKVDTHQALIKVLHSSYRDIDIDLTKGAGIEIAYIKQWPISKDTNISLEASHFISDDFFNPLAHPGYNQKEFTQLGIDATWLRNDQLNISTGMNFDIINGSLSTIQYLNISVLID